jgi:hypothetical protein
MSSTDGSTTPATTMPATGNATMNATTTAAGGTTTASGSTTMSADSTTISVTTTTPALDASKLEGTASFQVPDGDVDHIVSNQTRKDAMKEGFAVAIGVDVIKFTKFEITKHSTRRLRVATEESARRLGAANLKITYAIDLTGVANATQITQSAKALPTSTLTQKVQEKLSAVGYNGAVQAKSFTAKNPVLATSTNTSTTNANVTTVPPAISAAISTNMWVTALLALFLYFV